MSYRRIVVLAWLLVLAMPARSWAGNKAVAPPLTREHRHPSGAFTFRTPADWRVGPGARPGTLEARGELLRVLFLFEPRELGYDGLHADCMVQRLRGLPETDPRVKYEYDYISGSVGERRFLDSAFTVRYDVPVDGVSDWRQRNLTVVGAGQSLCVISHAPLAQWKKSAAMRALIDSIVASVTFPAPAPATVASPAPPQ
jgi:hypothetical protein